MNNVESSLLDSKESQKTVYRWAYAVRVLVVENSPRMASVMSKGLAEECHAVDVAADGATGLRMAQSGQYDLVLSAVNLPEVDGFSLIRELRRTRPDVPVILVTGRTDVKDRVAGLDLGADDYVTKPFSFEELLARIRAVTRRPGARVESVLRYADIELDPAKGSAIRAGVPLELSAREFALLGIFLANPESVMTRARLYESVWGSQYDGISNVLDVYVSHLRTKLEETGGSRVIQTVRGRGYRLEDKSR